MKRLLELAQRWDLPTGADAKLTALVELVVGDDHAPTTVRKRPEVIDVHLADSLVALELDVVRDARVIADLGSGAGFPGLPLAIALPSADVSLVESASRKCAFLERGMAVAGISNATVVDARAEAWAAGIGRHDLVTARALAPLPVLMEYAAPLLREGGALVAWKGRRDAEEELLGAAAAGQLGMEVAEVRSVEPFSAARDRHLHVVVKASPTPKGFPRRPGMARKRPLPR